MKKPAENIWNVPNILTILRIALTPVYVVFYGKEIIIRPWRCFLRPVSQIFWMGKLQESTIGLPTLGS
jgi:phosphatidylglycerophosphate synthase